MTVIAWDGKSVAADSLATFGGYRSPLWAQKITRRDDFVYGITGFFGWFDAWIEWHRAGADPQRIPAASVPMDRCGNFLIFTRDSAFCCSAQMPYLQRTGAPDAWGDGCEYAIGAMLAGASAQRAAEVAISSSSSCDGPVCAIDLSDLDQI